VRREICEHELRTNRDKQTNNKGTQSLRPWSRVLSWETKISSASQEIPRILYNSEVHCRIHKSPPLVRILSHTNPLHATHSISWRFILSHLRLGFPSCLFPCQTKYLYTTLFPLTHATCLAKLTLLDLKSWNTFGEEYKSWSCSLCCLLLPRPFWAQKSSSAPYSQTTLSLCSSPNT
jgi:hypothetical protein